jgi:site-specific DNA-methyltransferase (adenine-specific)
LARKPLTGTVAANVLAHGTGALNIDGCRVVTDGPTARPPLSTEKHEGWQRPWNADPEARAGVEARREVAHDKRDNLGRFPANVIHDGSPEVVEAFPASDAGEVNPNLRRHAGGGLIYGEDGGGQPKVGHGDSGSAARFFYSAKADAVDRHGSRHPTVKPVDLMQYLCRLVTPPGGLVLDPFAGSGTTGIAAQREGFRAILIEREADYVADIHRRLKWEKGEGRLTSLERAKLHTPKAQAKANGLDTPLFGPKGDA